MYHSPASALRGELGLGSVSMEEIESSTLEMESAGLHWSLRMSMQMPPSDEMLGWKTLVENLTLGGLNG